MPNLELQLLGTPLWSRNGTPLKGFVTRKAEALLIYLAVEQRIHRRTALAGLFWPDVAEQHAHNSLRRTLSNLRTMVGSHLVIDRYTVAFDRQSNYRLDVEQFKALLTPSKKNAKTPLSIEELGTALSLYRDEFLMGFVVHDALPFEEWLRKEREYLHDLAVQALEQLTDLGIQRGKFEAALASTQRLLTIQPWQETAHQQRMKLLAVTGQQSAALAQFELCRKILLKEFGSEPQPETVALNEQIKVGAFDLRHALHATTTPSAILVSNAAERSSPEVQIEWGEMPRQSTFFGREEELRQLQHWLLEERCALVTILGVGGSGKTTLAAQLTRLLTDNRSQTDSTAPFTHIIWRSLVNTPLLTTLLHQWLVILSGHQQSAPPETLPDQLELLFGYLRQQRCLLILDNLESLLQTGTEAGIFRPEYEEYGTLFRQLGEMQHLSCLLLTSREEPVQVARLEREYPQVRSLVVQGLPAESAVKVLQSARINGVAEQLAALAARYSGNPLALKLIAETIQDFFGGDIDAFLGDNTPVFDDIRHMLDQQFQRLSLLEQEILCWLAIAREPLSADPLQSKLMHPPTKRLFIEALRSLQRRSLLETAQKSSTETTKGEKSYFQLQNVVTEYLTDFLIDSFCQEVASAQLKLFLQFGLVNAQSREYIRTTQIRLLLQPVLQCLRTRLGDTGIHKQLSAVFHKLKTETELPRSFAAANLIHLWQALDVDISGFDFSHLCVREADLRGARLAKVNFSNANLAGTVFSEIFNAVLSLAYSPDGQILAVATTDGIVRLWQVSSMQLVAICPGNGRWIWSVGFSPDGRFLATGCADRHVRIWQLDGIHSREQATAELTLHQILSGHTDAVFAVCFSPNNQQFASASADGTIRIWQTQSSNLLQTIAAHSDAVNTLVYSPDGCMLASGSRDTTIRIWNTESGSCRHILTGHENEVKCASFSPDGKLLATASYDRTVRLWHSDTGVLYRTIQCDNPDIQSVRFHPDGHTIAVNDQNYSLRLWEIESGTIRRTFLGHTNTIHAIAFSPSGNTIVSGGWDRTVRFWDTQSGDALHTLQGHQNDIKSIAIGHAADREGQWLAHGNTDQQIYLWDTQCGEQLQTLSGHSGAICSIAFSPNSKHLISGSADRTVRIWQIDSQQSSLFKTLYGHTGEIAAVAFSPNGEFLASAGEDRTIRLWETATGRPLQILYGHPSAINALAFCPTSYKGDFLLVSGDEESNIYGWQLSQQRGMAEQASNFSQPDFVLSKVPPNGIKALAFAPQSCLLAAGGAESIIQLWQIGEQRPLRVLVGHTSSIYSIAFSVNGKTIASGSGDQTVCLWDANSGELMQTLHGHKGVVQSVVFHPNGNWLISSSSDETVKIWSLSTGDCLKTLRPASLYQGMNIHGATGITVAQRTTLKALGAVE